MTPEAEKERDAVNARLAEIATHDFMHRLEEAIALVGWSCDMVESNNLYNIIADAKGLPEKHIDVKYMTTA
jgi:hypothetical protein